MTAEALPKREKRPSFTCEVFEAPTRVARNTYRIRLHKPDGFEFLPGQAIKFPIVRGGEVVEKKSFTIASAPHEPFLEFVFRVSENESDWSKTKKIIMSLKAGDSVPVFGVLPDFSDEVIYPINEKPNVPIVMLAGGVGVTPFISMLRHAKEIGDTRDFHLLYANPTQDAVPYGDETLEHAERDTVHTQGFLTQEQEDGYQHGHFSKESLSEIVRQVGNDALFFVSGPTAMLENTKKILEELGIGDRVRCKDYGDYESGID